MAGERHGDGMLCGNRPLDSLIGTGELDRLIWNLLVQSSLLSLHIGHMRVGFLGTNTVDPGLRFSTGLQAGPRKEHYNNEWPLPDTCSHFVMNDC